MSDAVADVVCNVCKVAIDGPYGRIQQTLSVVDPDGELASSAPFRSSVVEVIVCIHCCLRMLDSSHDIPQEFKDAFAPPEGDLH